MKITPRTTADRGGYLMMPMKANVPNPKDKNWKLVNCPRCGRECWDRPLPEGYRDDQFDGKLCTECALRVRALPEV